MCGPSRGKWVEAIGRQRVVKRRKRQEDGAIEMLACPFPAPSASQRRIIWSAVCEIRFKSPRSVSWTMWIQAFNSLVVLAAC